MRNESLPSVHDEVLLRDNTTLVRNGINYILSQVRICRKCKKTMDLRFNFEYYLDDENRIALLQHKDCNPKPVVYGKSALEDYLPRGIHVISAEDKHHFLYGNNS